MDIDRDVMHNDFAAMNLLQTNPEARTLLAKTEGFLDLAVRLDEQWRSIKVTESVGRIHNAKERADAKAAMDTNVKTVCELFKTKAAIEEAQVVVESEQRASILGGNMTSIQVRAAKDKISLYSHAAAIFSGA